MKKRYSSCQPNEILTRGALFDCVTAMHLATGCLTPMRIEWQPDWENRRVVNNVFVAFFKTGFVRPSYFGTSVCSLIFNSDV